MHSIVRGYVAALLLWNFAQCSSATSNATSPIVKLRPAVGPKETPGKRPSLAQRAVQGVQKRTVICTNGRQTVCVRRQGPRLFPTPGAT
jgi:hypothetical protein